MEQTEILYGDNGMNDETYNAFVAGLKSAIEKSGYKTQKDFAVAIGIPPETLSKHVNNRQRMREETIRRYAEVLNITEADIVMMGRDALNKKTTPPPAPTAQRTPDHVDVDNFLAASWALATQYRKADKDQKWWKEIFDMLPSPTLIVENEVVIHQNKPSEIWGKIAGKSIHEVQLNDGDDGDDCPLKMAIETKQESSVCKYIRDDYYKVVASPFRYDGRDIFIVTCTEVNETVGGFRRDRRADIRREEDKNI